MPSLAECALGLLKRRLRPTNPLRAPIPRISAAASLTPQPRRLAAYNDLCGFTPSPLVPLTWPYAIATPLHVQLVSSPEFPFSPFGLVHTREVIRQLRPIPADAKLWFRCHIEGQRPHRRGIELDLLTEVSLGQDAEVIWQSTTSALVRTKDRRPTSTPPPADPLPPRGSVWHVAENTGRRYARISRNVDPIHLHALTSRWFGFRRPIVHGMWSVARSIATLHRAPSGAPRTLQVDFKWPLFLPSEVLFCADAGEHRRRFAIYDRSKGRSILTGALS